MMIAQVHKSAQVSATKWLYLMVLGWLVLVGLPLIPPSIWFDVHFIHVEDTVAGRTPVIAIDRDVNLPFRGRWQVTVMRQEEGSVFRAYCVSTGAQDYNPSEETVKIAPLDRWTWPVRCSLPVGTYRLSAQWTMDLPLLPQKKLQVDSNVFHVMSPV